MSRGPDSSSYGFPFTFYPRSEPPPWAASWTSWPTLGLWTCAHTLGFLPEGQGQASPEITAPLSLLSTSRGTWPSSLFGDVLRPSWERMPREDGLCVHCAMQCVLTVSDKLFRW